MASFSSSIATQRTRKMTLSHIYVGATSALLILTMGAGKMSVVPPINLPTTTLILIMRSPTRLAKKPKTTYSTTTMCWRNKTRGFDRRSSNTMWHKAARSIKTSCE